MLYPSHMWCSVLQEVFLTLVLPAPLFTLLAKPASLLKVSAYNEVFRELREVDVVQV